MKRIGCIAVLLIIDHLFLHIGNFLHSYCWLRSFGVRNPPSDGLLDGFTGEPVRAPAALTTFFFDHDAAKNHLRRHAGDLGLSFSYRKPSWPWIFFTFGNMIRLRAIMRIYSSAVVRLCMPRILANRVSTSWKVQGIKAKESFGAFLVCDFGPPGF